MIDVVVKQFRRDIEEPPTRKLPKPVQEFFKQYGKQMPPGYVIHILDALNTGVSVKVTTPDGKQITLEPYDAPQP